MDYGLHYQIVALGVASQGLGTDRRLNTERSVSGDMSSTDDHDHDAEAVTDRVHDNSWSANLEKPQYADDPELAVRDGVVAIEHTAPGNHVNLVTHGDLGHPEEFLYDALTEEYDEGVDWEYIQQCGCGGHVTRVYVD
ncbi:MAG: putative CGCGG family rSAM target protein [Natronomonas sp.]|jgi:putative CGCGG family rSAM target protein